MLEKQELQLKARHVVLRRIRPEDAQTLYDYRSLPEVARYQDWLPDDLEAVHALARQQAGLRLGEPGSWFQWIICNAATAAISSASTSTRLPSWASRCTPVTAAGATRRSPPV